MGQSGRYELKYIVEERRAHAIADFLRAHLQPSAHNGDRGHPVISLYLDSPDFFFFHQGFAGHKNRIKLRIRIYDDEWSRPAFLEIKRRVGEVICKERAMISREAVREMLTAGWPNQAWWPDPKNLMHGKRRLDVGYQFWKFCHSHKARGMIYVSYLREIWESTTDEELRVTFDREIRGSHFDGSGRLGVPRRGWRPAIPFFPHDGVVLELKFEERPPSWMQDLVRIFNLHRTAVCKYCGCIERMGMQWGRPILGEYEEDMVQAWNHPVLTA